MVVEWRRSIRGLPHTRGSPRLRDGPRWPSHACAQATHSGITVGGATTVERELGKGLSIEYHRQSSEGYPTKVD